MTAHPLVERLSVVLRAFKPKAQKIITELVTRELTTRWLNGFLVDKNGSQWRIGEESPSEEGAIVFAIVEEEEPTPKFLVFSFRSVETSEGEGVQFFREVIYEPSTVHSSGSGKALYDDLVSLLGPLPEAAPAALKNGNGKGPGEGDEEEDETDDDEARE